jgi:hypothetical protein
MSISTLDNIPSTVRGRELGCPGSKARWAVSRGRLMPNIGRTCPAPRAARHSFPPSSVIFGKLGPTLLAKSRSLSVYYI